MISGANIIPIKIPEDFFEEIDKPRMNFIWKYKRPRLGKTVLKKSNKVEKITCFDFKTFYKYTVIKRAGLWHKNGYTEKWKRIKRKKNLLCLSSIDFDKIFQ